MAENPWEAFPEVAAPAAPPQAQTAPPPQSIPSVSPVSGRPIIELWDRKPKAGTSDPSNPWSAFPEVEAPAKPKETMGRLAAGVEGAKAGLSANFWDELSGTFHASGLPKALEGLPHELRSAALGVLAGNPLTAGPALGTGIARMGIEALTGPGEATKAYEGARDESRATAKRAKEEHPGMFLGGEVAGTIAAPGGALMRGATLPIRMARGAAVGGVQGTVSGAGQGEDLGDRATRAGIGGVTGLAIGAVAPPAVETIAQAARAVARPIVDTVRGAFHPGDEAARRVTSAIGRDAAADPGAVSRLTPAEFAATRVEGGPAMVMDLGGETTRALARSAGNTSPEGRGALNRAIDDRFEGQSGRISDWLRNAFHFPDAHAQQQAIDQASKTVNRAAYARSYREGDRGLWSPELERLTSSPDVVAAMKDAATKGKSRAVVEGFGGFSPGVTVEGDVVKFAKGESGVPTYPNLQFWDYTKRALDDSAKAAGRAGRTDEASYLGQLARQLRGELDTLVPSYAHARAGAAHFFGAENALEAGQNFVGSSQRFGLREATDALRRMTPTERQLFQDGYVSRFIERIEATGDRRNVLNQIGASPAARREIAMALGPHRAAELEARLRIEGIQDLARGAVQGNSTTARQLAELGLAGGAGGLGAFGTYHMDPVQMGVAALAGGLIAGRHHIDQRVAQRVAQMLVSQDPAVLTRGIQIVARNNRLMDNLRSADLRISRIGGQQTPGVTAIQSAGTGRADENQPNVPRPPGQ